MYLFLDESGTDGKSKITFVGGVYTKDYPVKSIIKKTILKSFKKAPRIDEYKYNDRRFDLNLKNKVLKKITYDFVYLYSSRKSNNKNVKHILCKLISECIKKVNLEYKGKIFVIYDQMKLDIKKSDIEKFLGNDISFEFEMKNSKIDIGIQYADWIVGAVKDGILK